MHYMEHKSLIAGGITLVLIIAGMFIFAHLKKQEIVDVQQTETESVQTDPYAYITRIDAKHFFINGTHTLVGEILMPTQCDLLNWDAKIQESSPETVLVDFAVINHAETCAQVMTPQRFKLDATASELAKFRARFMGRDVELNLIPASAGETPDDYELFIKG